MELQNVTKIHFIGIGGSGLSALARICKGLGFRVSGSDISESKNTRDLKEEGVGVFIGHRKENIDDKTDLIIVTSAIIDENPEIEAAKSKGIPVFKRDFLLGKLMENKIGIAISGTHGKTTTTAMVAHLLKANQLDPTFLIGGISNNYQTNAQVGKGKFFVIEADEYDRAFWGLKPKIGIVTSIEMDHPDCYNDIEEYADSFKKFLHLVPNDGLALGCGDWPEIKKIFAELSTKILNYGEGSTNDWYFSNLTLSPGGSSFDTYNGKEKFGRFKLNIPGKQNVTNAMVPIVVGNYLEIPLEGIKKAIRTFSGTEQRFDILGVVNDIMVVEDYAHHPTAVRVTLDAALTYQRPVKAIYQPHQYARTAILLNDYKGAFTGSKKAYLNKIYAARDRDTTCVKTEDLLEVVKKDVPNAEYIEDTSELAEKVAKEAEAGELILVMGVGNGRTIAEKILSGLRERFYYETA